MWVLDEASGGRWKYQHMYPKGTEHPLQPLPTEAAFQGQRDPQFSAMNIIPIIFTYMCTVPSPYYATYYATVMGPVSRQF